MSLFTDELPTLWTVLSLGPGPDPWFDAREMFNIRCSGRLVPCLLAGP